MTSGERVLFYSHDSYGLGHLRRTLALARAVSERDGRASSLILTGSTVASSYQLPPRVDTVKLPVMTKDPDGHYQALRLPIDTDDLCRMRSAILAATAETFAPTVAVVDKTPLGVRGELTRTLDLLRDRGDCRLVLGLRDIEDDPVRVRRQWGHRNLRALIERYYDAILVYGPESSLDALDCMGWDDLRVPVHHVGYVGAPLAGGPPADFPADYLLVTAGGGGDGFDLLVSVLAALRLRPLRIPTVIVAGPLLADEDLRRLLELAAGLNVRVHEFRADMEAVVAGASAVVGMAGYNTVAELLAARKPALLVPRIHPRREQLMRAQALVALGLADMLRPDELSAETMADALCRLLERPQPDCSADLGGAARAAEILASVRVKGRAPQIAALTAA